MRSLMLMLCTATLLGCGANPNIAGDNPALPPLTFAAQSYPNQTLQCTGQTSSTRGHIQWMSATTNDSIRQAVKFYNRKTGILKRRTKPTEHLWSVVDKSSPVLRSLSLMSLEHAERLHLMCDQPIPNNATTAIIVSNFTAAAPTFHDYAHAAP